jgi:hypothetical protein
VKELNPADAVVFTTPNDETTTIPLAPRSAADRYLANPEGINQYTVGQKVRFDGKSADGNVIGSMPVMIVDPHSNAHLVTQTKGKRQYEGANRHLPTATVVNERGRQFEAYHHTLRAASSYDADQELLQVLAAAVETNNVAVIDRILGVTHDGD